MTDAQVEVRPPAPALADALVRLRPLEASDAADVERACQDTLIGQWTTIPQPYTADDARAFVEATRQAWREGRDPTFAVDERSSGQLAGAVGLRGERAGRWEIGYWIAPWARGKGIATAAVRLVTQWALRDLGARRIGLLVYPGNEASVRVAQKAGYRHEGVLRRYAEQRGELRDVIVHSIIAEDGDAGEDTPVRQDS